MSVRNKNIRSFVSGFFRYHKDSLSGKERNSFERELQKDPFAEEAADGFSLVSEEDAAKDIGDLQNLLARRTSGKRRVIFFRIAASIAVLMIISTVYIFLEKNKTTDNLADNSVPTPELKITTGEPLTEQVSRDKTLEIKETVKEKKTDRSAGKQSEILNAVSSAPASKDIASLNRKDDSSLTLKSEPVMPLISDEKRSVPARAMAKDKVVTGYGTKRYNADEEDVSPDHSPPQPSVGKSKFNKYIQENLHRPDTLTKGQRVVVVLGFLVRSDGNIDSIKIVRSPGKVFSDEAIRVLRSGPGWNPAKDKGNPVEEYVRLRLVFR